MIDTMKKTLIIGIAGASGSGKSLLARTLVKELGSKQVVIISEDAYYKDRPDLSFEERAKINYDHPDAFEHSLLRDHLHALKNGETIERALIEDADANGIPDNLDDLKGEALIAAYEKRYGRKPSSKMRVDDIRRALSEDDD